jgi:hypothetical protein
MCHVCTYEQLVIRLTNSHHVCSHRQYLPHQFQNSKTSLLCYTMTLGQASSRLQCQNGYIWVDPDSVAGTASHYKLDSPGTKFCWRQDFPQSSRPALEPTHHRTQWVFPPTEWTGGGFNHPPPSSEKVKERVDLYL